MPKFKRVWKHIAGTNKPKRYKRAWEKIKPKYGVNGSVGPAIRFTWEETECSDGSTVPLDLRDRVVIQARALNKLRKVIAKHYGVKFSDVSINVNSWYRSKAYNDSIGGATQSQHVKARATDITVLVGKTKLQPKTVAELAKAVTEFKLGGIGWYDEKHGSFTHLDSRPDGPARWVNNG